MRILVLVFALTISNYAYGQYNKNNHNEVLQTGVVDCNGQKCRPAEFKGGMKGLFKYLRKKLKYPKDAKEKGIQGKVLVQFTLDETGQVKSESVKVIQGLSETCDAEAVRLIRTSPRWTPMRNLTEQKNVPTQYTLPIAFQIR